MIGTYFVNEIVRVLDWDRIPYVRAEVYSRDLDLRLWVEVRLVLGSIKVNHVVTFHHIKDLFTFLQTQILKFFHHERLVTLHLSLNILIAEGIIFLHHRVRVLHISFLKL